MGDVLCSEWAAAGENLGCGGGGGSCWHPVLWSWPSRHRYVDGFYMTAISGEEIDELLCTWAGVTRVTAQSSSHWGWWVVGVGDGDATNISWLSCSACGQLRWQSGASVLVLSVFHIMTSWDRLFGWKGTVHCWAVFPGFSNSLTWVLTLREEDTLGCTVFPRSLHMISNSRWWVKGSRVFSRRWTMEGLLIKSQTDSLSSGFIFGSFWYVGLNYSVLSHIPLNKLVSPVSVAFFPSSFHPPPFLQREGGCVMWLTLQTMTASLPAAGLSTISICWAVMPLPRQLSEASAFQISGREMTGSRKLSIFIGLLSLCPARNCLVLWKIGRG